MFRPRVIPILLLKNSGLVKSEKFKKFTYIGDPINAVKLFNDFKADEIVFLDILASREQRQISLDFVKNVGSEANMPFAVGGGIRTIPHIKDILNAGAEKVIVNTHAVENPDFILEASNTFGSSTITVSIDIKKNLLGKQRVYYLAGSKVSKYNPVEFAQLMESKGAGELLINNIDRDGSMQGYDLHLIQEIANAVSIPVVATGGAGTLNHLIEGVKIGHASAVAAGSLFVYYKNKNAVLINYPSREELTDLFINDMKH